MEDFKKILLGCDGDVPELIIAGQQINDNMLTMIGYNRLTNIEVLIKDVVEKNIEGDVIEAGIWRGGACMFMRKLLNELESDKKVFVADSFEGLPKPNPQYPHDNGDYHHTIDFLSVSLEQVMKNFESFGLLENTVFIKGWFKDTLPKLEKKFSLIRLDGDMYSSTIDALNSLYPKLSVGGYCIIDDYGAVVGCQEAVKYYRKENRIESEMVDIDGCGVYWKKTKMDDIQLKYKEFCDTPSDINLHLPMLREYADRCDHVTEFGVRGCVSLHAFLSSKAKKVVAVDIGNVWVPDIEKLTFICADDLTIEIEQTDFLFIDTLHTYNQLSRELALHSKKVNKYIGFHDTSMFGVNGDDGGIGLVPAINEFLQYNKEWSICYSTNVNNGLTIIEKK